MATWSSLRANCSAGGKNEGTVSGRAGGERRPNSHRIAGFTHLLMRASETAPAPGFDRRNGDRGRPELPRPYCLRSIEVWDTGAVGAAGEIANVSHTFQPSGLFALSNSP